MLGGCGKHPNPAAVIGGGCAPASSPFLVQDAQIEGRITFCQGGDAWTGKIESQPYPPGTRNIEVMLSGYPGSSGVTINAVTSTGKSASLAVSAQPGEHWQRAMLAVPLTIAQEGYRLQIDDQSPNPFGWAGLGDLGGRPAIALANGLLPMLAAVLLGNSWLIAVSLCLPAGQPPRERLLQGLVAGGCGWLVIFLCYVISAKLGSVVGLLLLILPFPLALVMGRRRRTPFSEVADLHYALLPALMLVFLVLWIGLFPFHWDGQPNGDPALRWRGLTIDAWLPMLFGDMLAHGRLDVPMIGDWLSSDRPPLQVGLYLMFYTLLPDTHALVYQGISSWAQALIVVPVASLLARFMDKRPQAVALLVLTISALMLFNTLFVWPKLLAGAFSLIYYMALFPAEGEPRRWRQAGIAAAMALLAHGGALFFIVGVAIVHLYWYRRHSIAMLLRTGAVAVVFYLPWIAYQRFVDPPGDRLIKWHFAGKIPVSSESAMQAIVSAYAPLTPHLWLSARLQNLDVIVKGAISVPYDAWRVLIRQDPLFLSHFIDDDFVYLFHSMWFVSPLLLIPCMAVLSWRNRHRADPRFKQLLQSVLSVIVTTLVWVVLVFEGGATTIHIGAYASVLLLQLTVLAAAWRVNHVLFYSISVANVAVTLSAYIFDRQFLPGLQTVYVLISALLCAGLAAAILIACGCLRQQRTKRPVDTAGV